ncbi:glutaminyl-peptide cyclotransferase-like [Babylonia areolata]|uniref:glutaminyl-peptide cyclotransferase-like n=1 Tax=Babylonia areolata TaxID=304850 RepID=UPI003FD595C0
MRWEKIVTSICLLVFLTAHTHGKTKSQGKTLRWISKLEALRYLTAQMSDMVGFKREELNPLLTERISGTPEIVKVKEHIMGRMQKLGWKVEEDSFEKDTPFGRKNFSNVIATQDPSRPRRTIVACHYDSKDFKTKQKMTFVGAVDSAVPCAIMLETAKQLDCLLKKGPKEKSSVSDLTLQFVFFDGEEAFETWTSTDSLYGARHLADKWEKTSQLSSIRELILLDLIGAQETHFISHFEATASLFENLMKIEKHLRKNGMLSEGHKRTIFDSARSRGGGVEDDHVPFLQRGVDVLHLISTPFPRVWHKKEDDGDHLDFDLIDNFSRMFRVFISNLLHLTPEKIDCRKE